MDKYINSVQAACNTHVSKNYLSKKVYEILSEALLDEELSVSETNSIIKYIASVL